MPQRTSAFDTTSILIDDTLNRLEQTYLRVFGTLYPDYPNIIRSSGTMALEITMASTIPSAATGLFVNSGFESLSMRPRNASDPAQVSCDRTAL